MKNIFNFFKIPWNKLSYDWKWFKFLFSILPFVLSFPFFGVLISNFMKTYNNGVCDIYSKFHIYCPGCGATRATILITKLNVIGSFLLNPLPIYLIIIYSIFVFKNLLFIMYGNKFKQIRFDERYVYFALVLLVLNFFIKNLLLFYQIDINSILTHMFF